MKLRPSNSATKLNRKLSSIRILLSILFFLFVTGCNQQEPKEPVEADALKIPEDSLAYYNAKVLDSLIGLKNIESEKEREYRISFGLAQPEFGYIIIVRKEANNWRGELRRYLITKVDKASGLISSVIVPAVIAASPKSGNISFENKFEAFKIDSFRNSEDIPGFDECMGIIGITIKMSGDGRPREVSYACPLSNESHAPELKSLRGVIKYILDEFGFDLWANDPFELGVGNEDSLKKVFIEQSKSKEK